MEGQVQGGETQNMFRKYTEVMTEPFTWFLVSKQSK